MSLNELTGVAPSVVIVTDAARTARLNEDFYLVNRNGAVDLTLPARPTEAIRYLICDAAGHCAVGKEITIHGNGKTIAGAATLVMNQPYARTEIVFSATLDQWVIASFQDTASVSGAVQTFAIWHPGIPSAAPTYATLAEIEPLIAAADGAFTLYVDSSDAAATITGTLDGLGRLTLRPARGPVGGVAMTVTIADGAELKNILAVDGQLSIESATTTIAPLAFDLGVAGVTLSNGALLHLLAGATRAFLDVASGFGNEVAFQIDGSSQIKTDVLGVPFAQLAANALFGTFYSNMSPAFQPEANAVLGDPLSTWILVYDASVTLPDVSAFSGTLVSLQVDSGLVQQTVLDLPLATLQAFGASFAFSGLFPAWAVPQTSARLLSLDHETVEELNAPALASATAQIVDAITHSGLTGLANVMVGGGTGFTAPPPTTLQSDISSPNHVPNYEVSLTGDTFGNLTAGHIRARMNFTASPRATA